MKINTEKLRQMYGTTWHCESEYTNSMYREDRFDFERVRDFIGIRVVEELGKAYVCIDGEDNIVHKSISFDTVMDTAKKDLEKHRKNQLEQLKIFYKDKTLGGKILRKIGNRYIKEHTTRLEERCSEISNRKLEIWVEKLPDELEIDFDPLPIGREIYVVKFDGGNSKLITTKIVDVDITVLCNKKVILKYKVVSDSDIEFTISWDQKMYELATSYTGQKVFLDKSLAKSKLLKYVNTQISELEKIRQTMDA